MLKKLIVTGAAAGLLLVSASAAFASVSNHAHVTNNILTVANSGANLTGGHHASVTTGDATAVANTATVANTNVGGSHHSNTSNHASVTNNVGTVANSGLNFTGGGTVSTGAAGAQSDTLTVVNTNVAGF